MNILAPICNLNLPIRYCILRIEYLAVVTVYCISHIAYCVLARWLLHLVYCVLRIAYCVLRFEPAGSFTAQAEAQNYGRCRGRTCDDFFLLQAG